MVLFQYTHIHMLWIKSRMEKWYCSSSKHAKQAESTVDGALAFNIFFRSISASSGGFSSRLANVQNKLTHAKYI